MNSPILTALNIEVSKALSFRCINLQRKLHERPYGYIEFKDGLIWGHFGYIDTPNAIKVITDEEY